MSEPTHAERAATIASEDAPLSGVSEFEAASGLLDALAGDEFDVTDPPETVDDEEPVDDDQEDEAWDVGDEPEEDLDDEDDLVESEVGDAEPAEIEHTLYEVTLPGGEKKKVDLNELLSGYSRTEDYTRKRQADAEEHRTAMAEVGEVRSKYDAHLAKLQQVLTEMGPPAPDARLRQTNPGEYAAQLAEYNAYQAELATVGQARDTVAKELSAEEQDRLNRHMASEWQSLLSAVPTWSDQEVRTKELAALMQHGINELGFTKQELESTTDHRLILLLRENYELKQQRKKGKDVVEEKKAKAGKRLKPGNPQRRSARTRKGRQRQEALDARAQQTGSVTDVARAIEHLLD